MKPPPLELSGTVPVEDRFEPSDAAWHAEIAALKKRIAVLEKNETSAVGAMRHAMEAQKKAEVLARDRLDGLLAAASFAVMLMKEVQRLQEPGTDQELHLLRIENANLGEENCELRAETERLRQTRELMQLDAEKYRTEVERLTAALENESRQHEGVSKQYASELGRQVEELEAQNKRLRDGYDGYEESKQSNRE